MTFLPQVLNSSSQSVNELWISEFGTSIASGRKSWLTQAFLSILNHASALLFGPAGRGLLDLWGGWA